MIGRTGGRPLSIYVHFPYCSKLCTFCAFNKYKLPANLDEENMYKSYRSELSHYLQHYAAITDARKVRSVYLGGGTPSLSPKLVGQVLAQLDHEGFTLTHDAEITLEANPSSLPPIQFLSDLGVTRVSLGVQTLLNDRQLRNFNREHSAAQSLEALELLAAKRHLLSDGFSFDLMFGNPISETNHRFSDELDLALPFARVGGHLSIYELTVEHGTPLASQVRRSQVVMPTNDQNAEEYEVTIAIMRKNDFRHYEISSFALPGHYGRHNYAFWMHEDLVSCKYAICAALC